MFLYNIVVEHDELQLGRCLKTVKELIKDGLTMGTSVS